MDNLIKNQTIQENYIGRAVCEILGYSNESFIEKEMETLQEYVDSKQFYEIGSCFQDGSIGVTLASKIIDDYKVNENKNMLIQIYNMFLSQIANLVVEKHYEQAIEKYFEMVTGLAKYFGIPDLEEEKSKQSGKIIMMA